MRWWRRQHTEVVAFGRSRARVTRRGRRIVGVETWTPLPGGDGYAYTALVDHEGVK